MKDCFNGRSRKMEKQCSEPHFCSMNVMRRTIGVFVEYKLA